MNIRFRVIYSVIILLNLNGLAAQPEHLRTNALINPVTVDTPKPRFSWNLSSDEIRGTVQESYRINVSDENGNIIWDSGVTDSQTCSDVTYEGTPLQPLKRYYWNVATKDSNGKEHKSNEKAWFETGLMDAGWEGAKWILPLSDTPQEHSDIKSYSIDMDVEIANIAAGIVFGATDRHNYYMWQFNYEEGYPRFRPHHWSNGVASCDAEIDLRNIKGFELNKPFHVTITMDGNKASTFIDGSLIDERINPTGDDFLLGEVAIRQDFALWNSSNPEKAYFDNIVITDLSDGTPTVVRQYDFEDGNNPFDAGTVTNGRLFVSGSYAWPQKAMNGTETAYDLDLDFRIINDAAGILFSADSKDDTFMWSIIIKGGIPTLRRHIRTGGNWTTSDVNLSRFLTISSLKNKTHHLKLEIRPRTVRTYLDDILVDTFTDTTGTLHYGKTGFRTFHDGSNNEIVLYDNIVLKVYEDNDATDNGRIVFSEDFENPGHCYPEGVVANIDGNKMLRLDSSYEETCIFAELNPDGIPVIRRDFTAKGPIVKARISASALGLFDLRVNGKRVGNVDEEGNTVYDELKPGWTDYRSSVNYYSYDITPLMQEGRNIIGAELSNGWWAGAIAHGVYGMDTPLSFIARIDLEYSDGTSETIVTDEAWKWANSGPIISGDIYNGEIYDARRDYSWATVGFDASEWKAVTIGKSECPEIVSPASPPVRVRPQLSRKPMSVTFYNTTLDNGSTYGILNVEKVIHNSSSFKLAAGETAICDFGQNLVGNVRLRLKTKEGTRIRVRFGEMLNDSGKSERANDGPEGSLYTYNLRTANASVYYTASGAADGETYSPTTSFFGFRYCEIIASGDVEITGIEAQVIGSDIEEYGELETSNKDLNQLISNIRWGQRGNFLSIPTDCPQRDERLGWTGDTQIFSRSALYASDARSFYHKWMDQMRQGQREDGAYPDIAPFCNFWGYGNAAWGDAGIIVPWTVYEMTGDKLILEENYASNQKYMQFLANQADGNNKYNGAGTSFGDWLAYEDLDPRYVSVAYYGYVSTLMGHIASALGKEDDAEVYYKLHDDISAEFCQRYIEDDNLTIQSQTALLLPLAFDLFENENQKKNAITALRERFMANGYKLQTGFVGTGLLNTTLSALDLDDIAYNLMLQRDNPSWLYSVDQGATTIWERWDSYTLDGGFNKHPWIMNSFNHYAYGAIYEWMMRYMAGIEVDKNLPGFRHIIFQPRPDIRISIPDNQERVTSVSASTRTPLGKVESKWENNGENSFKYSVTIPVGATATMYLPVADEECFITESGKPLEEAECVTLKGYSDGVFIVELESGSYKFEINNPASVSVKETVKVNVLPNPFHDVLKITDVTEKGTINIVNTNGVTVYNGRLIPEIDTSSWPAGFYFITLHTGKANYIAKAIKR